MGLHLVNLDSRTREYMLSELDRDVNLGCLFLCERLSETGQRDYPGLLKKALGDGDIEGLASELRVPGLLCETEECLRNGKLFTRRVPVTAAGTLAEGEFNRFYIRGLCLRAIDDQIPDLLVYRAKIVNKPRPESEQRIGSRLPARSLLGDLRNSIGVDLALGVPGGPNSGLSVRLP